MAIAPALACAQLYQCAGPEGRPVITDKPCDDKARPLELPPPARPFYDVEVDVRSTEKLATPLQYTYYEIRGTTLADVRKDIEAKAIETRWGKAVGMMKPRLDVRWETLADKGGRCALTAISVVADSTVWIPRWTNEQESPAGLREIVNAFVQRVAAHEQGHVNIHVETGQEIVRSLRAIRPGRSCEDIRSEARQRTEALIQQSAQRQREYDERAKQVGR